VARGHQEFLAYVHSVRGSLADDHCEILQCVTELKKGICADVVFGVHVASFLGFAPAGKPVQWHGAALFTFRENLISKLWVLGDLAGLDLVLKANAMRQPASPGATRQHLVVHNS
jgi:predicted ester cyclase